MIRRIGLSRYSGLLAVLVAWLVATVSSVACAQQSDTSPPGTRAARVLAGLESGQHVRIRTNAEGLVEGRVLSTSESFVTIRSAGSATKIPAASVDSLWTRSTHAGRGALVGGATLGLGFGALAASVCPRECDISSGTAFVRGGLVGVALGGVIGGLVGLAGPSWRRRVPVLSSLVGVCAPDC